MTHEGLKRYYVAVVSDLSAKTRVKKQYVRLIPTIIIII